jgi:transposase-like protein
MGRRGHPVESRRRVRDLVESGRPVADVAKVLGISDQTIYAWRRLRAENRELRRANEIVEAAAGDARHPQRPNCARVAGGQVMVRRTRTNR